MSDIQEFNYLVPYEVIEIKRWDRLELQSAKELFLQYTDSIKTLLEIANGLEQKEFLTLERYLCYGRKLANMLRFLKTVFDGNQESYTNIVIPVIEAELQNLNGYDEPAWILWKRYLQNVLDVLRRWDNAAKDQRLIIIFQRNKLLI
jgi:hypothetical protein